jgi:predicted phage terminase large subunit-like protein
MNSALHPERYTLEALLKRKATYYAQGQQRWWAALYQQNPAPDEGAYFTKDMFKYYVNPPHKLERNVYQAWDFAITESQQGDYIVGSTAEQDHRDNLYFTDIMRFKSGDSFLIVDSILDFWVIHGSEALLGFEDGQIWKSIEAVFKRRCEERRLYPSYEVLKPFTDKFVRAQPLRGRMQQGKVWFPKDAPWFDALHHEFLRFGAGGKHDDQVDSCSWVTRLALNHSAPRLKEPPPIASWKDRLALTLKGRGGGHMAA